MDSETKQALEAMEARIMKRFEQTDEKIFDVETKLLSAFRDWSLTSDARTKVLPSIQERLTVMRIGSRKSS